MRSFWKLNRYRAGDGTMITYAHVRCIDLGDYIWDVCVYIMVNNGKRLWILVGNFTS